MEGQARVGSIDALEAFRAALIRYAERTRRALDDVTGEVKRTRGWLESEQRLKWENERRRRARALEQAEQELFSARLSAMHDDLSAQRMALRRAARALAEADEKLAAIRRWRQAYESRVEGLARQLDGLQEILSRQLPKGVVALTNSIRLLQDYAGTMVSPQPAIDPERSEP
jgi:chromosome segregation ATPase